MNGDMVTEIYKSVKSEMKKSVDEGIFQKD